ncbi:MAG: glycosyltransferase [Solirubrobacteraceae bacterium]|nr:glycosyltransferase [Solirubrobacteraceae bacterium]
MADPASQEAELISALTAEANARDAVRAADAAAAATAHSGWSWRRRRILLPLYLKQESWRTAARGRTIGLGALPTSPRAQRPTWRHEQVVGGVERLAISVDPPTSLRWSLELARPVAVCGWFALRSEAWEAFRDPLELAVRALDEQGATVAETVVRIQPATRPLDRRWIPWRAELPAVGACTLELATYAPLGSMDYAWAVVGDVRIDLGGSPLAASSRMVARSRAWLGSARRRSRPLTPTSPIAILMPVHDPPLALLEATIASVLGQTSSAWELCVADDGSRNPVVRARLQELAASDPRVRLVRHDEAGGISAATNAACALASAPYVATLDHDDLLHPEAIASVGAALAADDTIDVLYTDNDLVAGERLRFSAALKPDWSPDLLRAVMYTLHLGVYRRSLVEEAGGWRSAFDGAQDHDLVLRLSERTQRIAHLPKVLAHWRAHGGSAALGELAKPLAYDRGRAAVAEHLERTGLAGSVERLEWAGRYHVRPERTRPVTVLLPVAADASVVEAWSSSVRDDDQVRVVGAGPGLAAWRDALDGVPDDAVVLIVEAPCVPSGDAAAALDELVGHVEAGAAAAGGLVVDDDARVLAGPVAFPEGLPMGVQVGADADDPSRHPSLTVASNRLAVRGVVALRAQSVRDRSVRQAGSLALAAVTLALGAAGARVLCSPHARFTATDAGTQMLGRTSISELLALDRGPASDPYWNPHLRPDLSDESYDELTYEGRA